LSLKNLTEMLIKVQEKQATDQKASEEKRQWIVRLFLMAGARSLSLGQAEKYVNFMEIRFPHRIAEEYAEEWCDRFATGHPEDWCDKESLNALASLEAGQTKLKR